MGALVAGERGADDHVVAAVAVDVAGAGDREARLVVVSQAVDPEAARPQCRQVDVG